jgi:transposase
MTDRVHNCFANFGQLSIHCLNDPKRQLSNVKKEMTNEVKNCYCCLMPREHATVDRWIVVAHHVEGDRESDIVHKTGLGRKFVARWTKRFEETGTVDDEPKSGRPTKITRAVTNRVRSSLKGKRGQSSRKVAARLKDDLSYSTVIRAAHKDGMRPYAIPLTTVVSAKQQLRRVEFAKRYAKKDWSRTIFGDEKTWPLVHPPNRHNDKVWAHSADEVQPHPKVRHPPKFHTWGAVSAAGLTPLHIFEETLTAPIYCDILRTVLLPSAARMFPRGDWTFVQDSDPKHTAASTQIFLRENVPDFIPPKDWPPGSPDFDIMENVWSVVQARVDARSPSTIRQLKSAVLAEWKKYGDDEAKKLVLSMPRRLKKAIDLQGASTGY